MIQIATRALSGKKFESGWINLEERHQVPSFGRSFREEDGRGKQNPRKYTWTRNERNDSMWAFSVNSKVF